MTYGFLVLSTANPPSCYESISKPKWAQIVRSSLVIDTLLVIGLITVATLVSCGKIPLSKRTSRILYRAAGGIPAFDFLSMPIASCLDSKFNKCRQKDRPGAAASEI